MLYFYVCFVVVFSVIGLCETIKGIVYLLTKGSNNRELILIKPLSDNKDDAEYQLRGIAEKIKYSNKNSKVIALDCNMDFETKKLCQMLCRDYSFMELYSKEDLINLINTL